MRNHVYQSILYLSLNKKKKHNPLCCRSGGYNTINNIRKKKLNEGTVVSTCLVTGQKKKIQKKINLNRHFLRTKYLKQNFLIWSKKTW